MIPIEKADNVNWDAIRAEYIGGGISQRKLAKKHGVSDCTLLMRANREHWAQDREKALNKAKTRIEQKAVQAIASNAEIAARIKSKLLRRLEREIDALPEKIGSELINTIVEYGKSEKGNRTRKESSQAHKLRDLTAAYKDLTDGMLMADESGNDLLQSLMDLERRVGHD